MLNVVLSLAAGLVVFTIACFLALQILPSKRGSKAACIRIVASCAIAILIAGLLYVYLEG